MRHYHRWVGSVAAVVFLFIALTGIALQLDLWIGGRAPPGAEERRVVPPTPLPDDETLRRMIQTAAAGYRAGHPAGSVERIELSLDGARPRASFGAAAADSPRVQIDLATGAEIPPPPRKANYHNLLQDLHAGYKFGLIGRIVSVLAGLSLLVLSVTGFAVYLDMFKRRRKAGRPGLFWRK